MRLHRDELPVDEALVRSLLTAQLPAYADLPLRPLGATGSSNLLFRLGDELLVRMPRQPGVGESVRREAAWGPPVAAALGVAVPEVVVVGEPADGYPEAWSVVRWIDGELPEPGKGGDDLALDLARTITELRAMPVPDDFPEPSYRVRSPAALDEDFREWLPECRAVPGHGLDLDALERLWADGVAASLDDVRTAWLHTDLAAENLLVRDGRLAAVLDLGGLTVGDPTVDLVVAFEVLDADARKTFRAALDVPDAAWARARAWAGFLAIMTVAYYSDTMPERCAHRRLGAEAALAG